jgi:hypothetical protein
VVNLKGDDLYGELIRETQCPAGKKRPTAGWHPEDKRELDSVVEQIGQRMDLYRGVQHENIKAIRNHHGHATGPGRPCFSAASA